jgi:hypothetical protein
MKLTLICVNPLAPLVRFPMLFRLDLRAIPQSSSAPSVSSRFILPAPICNQAIHRTRSAMEIGRRFADGGSELKLSQPLDRLGGVNLLTPPYLLAAP